jgi:acyl-CoA thioesterase I
MSRIVRLVPLCSLSVTLLAATAQAEPRKPTHVACVGDSITAGAGASTTAKNYVEQLKGLLGNGVQTLNFGVSGTTMLSKPFGDNPYTLAAQYTPSTTFVQNAGAQAVVSVVIILGANDSKPFNWDPAAGKNDQQYKKDYLALVDHYLGLTPKPVVYAGYPLATGTNPCCSISGTVIHDEEIPLIKQVAMEKHLPIIDLNTPTTDHPEYFGDGVHPNDAGYVVMAGLVKKGLEREPTISITSPTMGAMVSGAMVPLTADASADYVDISSVEFFEGATSLGKATAKPYTVNWAPTVGAHKVTAKVIDATLANATSTEVSFTVAAGGVFGGGGTSGSGGGGAGGASGGSGGSAGSATAGASTAGTPGTAGAATAGASSTAGSPGTAGSSTTPATSTDDGGCSCSMPGSRRDGGAVAWLLLGSVVSLAGLRRRAG